MIHELGSIPSSNWKGVLRGSTKEGFYREKGEAKEPLAKEKLFLGWDIFGVWRGTRKGFMI